MNWYELAGPDEVKKKLEYVLHNYWEPKYDYVEDLTTTELVRVYEYNYEIAEALWGEYSEELF